MNRTGWLGVLALGCGGVGVAAAMVWPSPGPGLDCAPAQVRQVDAGEGQWVAVCAPDAGNAVPVGAALTLGIRLNLNRATEGELARLPGVGKSLAAALVREREARNGFRDWNEVDGIGGVGPAKLEALQRATEIGE